ncbi:MAG: SsrA-binding protein SmpB [Parvibaculum sp.]|uniref:SsrA-binding protein SmpB n=1 Tax=Parvibaculum sp. TaxID=2024848 RepID=UPI00271844AA|nr:SsrA-binding protein SmpB [Parvibaculum sp.]MDO8840135.1 SsrA-binding protein SmpB [Parvibaculum sp.]MDP2123429.1 SsrA-binding protein SmpB [Parvibaculum sp.]MDZ4368324.1 SsrA-binding protein SmpB [Afipia sp.]
MSSKSGGAKKKAGDGRKIIADNRKARFNYSISETFEAGIELKGSEVKSLRAGQGSLNEAYAQATKGGEIVLVNAYIPVYLQANQFNHETRRPRKLLLHKREIEKLTNAMQRQGMTVVPLKMYFNERNMVKVEIGLAQGKKLADKRETLKERSWERDKARLLREKG